MNLKDSLQKQEHIIVLNFHLQKLALKSWFEIRYTLRPQQ